jgi:GTP1/Obg family GTP-binding protein
MGDCVDFGYISDIDPNKDYALSILARDYSKIFSCVSVPDEIVNEWIPLTKDIPTYFRSLTNPNYGIDHWGITLIPPQSTHMIADVIRQHTDKLPSKETPEINELLKLMQQVYTSDQYFISFGV